MNPDRFVIVYQLSVKYWLISDWGTKKPIPFMYELIDRGANFVVGDSKSVNEVVIGRFTTIEEAEIAKKSLVTPKG